MDKKTEKILDQLYADEIDVEEAAKALCISIEDVFELADNYNYIPISKEVIEACKIERETITHIKFIALQKVETKVRSEMVKPQLLSTPHYMDFRGLDLSKRLSIPMRNIFIRRAYFPLGLKVACMKGVKVTSYRREHRQYNISKLSSYYPKQDENISALKMAVG